MTDDARTSVMLVDDHSIMRDLLRDALENTGEFQVVAQAADGAEALRLVKEITPGRDRHGRDSCRRWTASQPAGRSPNYFPI